MHKALRYLFIGALLPLLVHYVFYYQLTTNYTKDAFSETGFRKIYDTKVYKSRQLGKQLHLSLYRMLSSTSPMKTVQDKKNDESHPLNTKRLSIMDPEADPVFYLTYFLIAVIFTVLTAFILLFLLDDKTLFTASDHFKDLLVSFFIMLIGFTQFVVTPYDTIGYFFQAAGMLFFLKYLKTKSSIHLIALILTIAIATLNRETSLLILSFMAAVYFYIYRFDLSWIKKMILPVLAFLLPYLYLKLMQGGGSDFTDESKLAVNLDIRNTYAIRGFAFTAFVLYFILITINKFRTPLTKYFLVFALPYIVIIHAVGVMIEYRLWLPVIESAIVLSLIHPSIFLNNKKDMVAAKP